MIALQPLKFALTFICHVNEIMERENKALGLSNTQRKWLAFCITGILLSNRVCWAAFERLSLGNFSASRFSWMFRVSKIPWDQILNYSVKVIFRAFDISRGTLVIDDTDNERSKNAKKIGKVHTIRCKETGGYFKGQNIIFLLLVTDRITIPVGFRFYEPDPNLRKWRKEDAKCRKERVPKSQRPSKPERDPRYPTKQEAALSLLRDFSVTHKQCRVNCVLADALYGSAYFMNEASKIFRQVISQIRKNQLIRTKGVFKSASKRFQQPGLEKVLSVRGQEAKRIYIDGARLYVKSHGIKRFVIALKYDGEAEYRYLIASDLTWAMTDIVKAHTLRWLVEVFIEDWKSNEGWCKMAKQPGVEGSSRGLILSLLTDHCLLIHPDQKAFLDDKLPARTVGSLRAKICFDSTIDFVRQILQCPNPEDKLKKCEAQLLDVIKLHISTKHAYGWDVGSMDSTKSLKAKHRHGT